MAQIADYLSLVRRLTADQIARGENDLSARLSRAFEELGLHTVIDTSGGVGDRRKRPDILVYLDGGTADLVGSAEVVVESKKPAEIRGDLVNALLGSDLWTDKFIPYCRAHIAAVRFFVLTTFERFLIVEIGDQVRSLIVSGEDDPKAYETWVRGRSYSFDLKADPASWEGWWKTNFATTALSEVPLSKVTSVHVVADRDDLGRFADDLATVVAGHERTPESPATLLHSVRIVATTVADLPPTVLASLTVYVMAQHRSMDAASARSYIAENLDRELTNFVSASVNSLIGRLFAYKVIEDCFCEGQPDPLLTPDKYVFHTDEYDGLDAPALLSAFMDRMRRLQHDTPPAIQSLAKTGSFYDWIEARVDPLAFRRLIRLIATRNFSVLEGDLLGRFFEHYAQRVDKRRRRQFGQYYTPVPIVSFMWATALDIAGSRAFTDQFTVLDPGVGSATFLVEGARRTAALGLSRFWDRLVGFDIDPQVIGVAYVNLFLAVLSELTPTQAEELSGLRLYPTDALDPSNSAPLEAILPLLTDPPMIEFLEGQIAMSQEGKRSGSYDVVIGNPPYHNNSDRTLQQVAEVFPRLLSTSRRNARARERNIRDDYAWFFAASDHYIRNDGLIAFVVSDSFCKLDSYRYFRIDLLRHYNIVKLIQLGEGVFEDVGPRISFVIIFMERRQTPAAPTDDRPIDYCDLRGFSAEARLELLSDAGSGGAVLDFVAHTPTAAHDYVLMPVSDLVERVKASGPPLFAAGGRGVFVTKWPGLITAFDILFVADSPQTLVDRWARFFQCVDATRRPDELIASFASALGADKEQESRLRTLISTARTLGLSFDKTKIKRAVTGSTPNDDRWYPSASLTRFVYYETALNIERNENEGRAQGWGTMNQWGVQQCQDSAPKLMFTTGSKARYGLKAFVVNDLWYVKLHGGTSQQFSYTMLDDPTKLSRLDGLPNNLTRDAETLLQQILDDGGTHEEFLLFIAGLYNSTVSELFLTGGGGKVLHIPLGDARAARAISLIGRRLRDLTFLGEAFAVEATLDLDAIPYDVSYLTDDLEIDVCIRGGGRMRQERLAKATLETKELMEADVRSSQEQLDDLVERIYGLGA